MTDSAFDNDPGGTIYLEWTPAWVGAIVAEPSAPRPRSKGAPKAADMASYEINKLGDNSATDEERATRKRRLISGPKEFRGMRRK